jgi:very-short-patch-repair endonuclease
MGYEAKITMTFFDQEGNESLVTDTWERIVTRLLNDAIEMGPPTPPVEKLYSRLSKCESPIEKLMFAALWAMRSSNEKWIRIEPQWPIRTLTTTYRTDFLVRTSGVMPFALAVECDGAAFHDEKESQVIRDRRRDRDFLQQAFVPIRFSGSEIWRDCVGCALEVWQSYHALEHIAFDFALAEKERSNGA